MSVFAAASECMVPGHDLLVRLCWVVPAWLLGWHAEQALHMHQNITPRPHPSPAPPTPSRTWGVHIKVLKFQCYGLWIKAPHLVAAYEGKPLCAGLCSLSGCLTSLLSVPGCMASIDNTWHRGCTFSCLCHPVFTPQPGVHAHTCPCLFRSGTPYGFAAFGAGDRSAVQCHQSVLASVSVHIPWVTPAASTLAWTWGHNRGASPQAQVCNVASQCVTPHHIKSQASFPLHDLYISNATQAVMHAPVSMLAAPNKRMSLTVICFLQSCLVRLCACVQMNVDLTACSHAFTDSSLSQHSVNVYMYISTVLVCIRTCMNTHI